MPISRTLKKRVKKVGLPPGSLTPTGEDLYAQIKISIIEWTEDSFVEKDGADLNQCLNSLESPAMTWIHVSGISDPSTITLLGNHFKIHSLVLEDILNTSQRSKFDEYNDQIFIVGRMLFFNRIQEEELHDEQLSIVFGSNYLISFLEKENPIFQPIRDRLRQGNNRIRKSGPDYLAYSLLDAIVDNYFVVLENFDNMIELLEEKLMSKPSPQTLQQIEYMKRQIIFLRKAVWPLREVINRFQYIESPLIKAATQVYLRDVHDHTVQTIDIIESFRDIVSGMIDLYLSNINLRLNEIVKVLTIVSTIFVPLTFITGIYGMNFTHMPELASPYGYPIVLLIMLSIAIGMLCFFRKRKWI